MPGYGRVPTLQVWIDIDGNLNPHIGPERGKVTYLVDLTLSTGTRASFRVMTWLFATAICAQETGRGLVVATVDHADMRGLVTA